MSSSDLVILEADHLRFTNVLERLLLDANGKYVLLLDKNGQQVAAAGDLEGVDPTSLASLTAGNVAATDGLAQLIGEREFSILFHEGQRENLHITVVGGTLILVVLFDERSSVGLVRLRVRHATPELEDVVREIERRAVAGPGADPGGAGAFVEMTADDIDALFR